MSGLRFSKSGKDSADGTFRHTVALHCKKIHRRQKKPDICRVYTVDVKVAKEQAVFQKIRGKNGQMQLVEEKMYRFPALELQLRDRPVIVGTGPAGLFCGYMLAKAGFRPLLLERGRGT